MRSCGTCNACCTVMGIPEIDKEPHSRCPSLTNRPRSTKGCTIYDDRPKSCSVFRCAWLEGLGSKTERPDLIGAVFIRAADRALIHVHQVTPGKWTDRADSLVNELTKSVAVVLMEGESRRLIGPPDEVNRILASVSAGPLPKEGEA